MHRPWAPSAGDRQARVADQSPLSPNQGCCHRWESGTQTNRTNKGPDYKSENEANQNQLRIQDGGKTGQQHVAGNRTGNRTDWKGIAGQYLGGLDSTKPRPCLKKNKQPTSTNNSARWWVSDDMGLFCSQRTWEPCSLSGP